MNGQARNYLEDPELYHKVQSSVPFEMEMYDVLLEQIQKRVSSASNLVLIDLCCGTCLFTVRLAESGLFKKIIGVEISPDYVAEAQKICHGKVELITADAATYRSATKADIVIGTSAYHHMRDQFKHQFTESVAANLVDGGYAYIIENFFSEYHDEMSYRESQSEYYHYLVSYLEKEKVGQEVIDSVRTARLIDYIPDDFKVDMRTFLKHLASAGLKLSNSIKVWPKEEVFRDKNAGGFVLEIIKKGGR